MCDVGVGARLAGESSGAEKGHMGWSRRLTSQVWWEAQYAHERSTCDQTLVFQLLAFNTTGCGIEQIGRKEDNRVNHGDRLQRPLRALGHEMGHCWAPHIVWTARNECHTDGQGESGGKEGTPSVVW